MDTRNWLADAPSSGRTLHPIAISMKIRGSILVEVLSVLFMLGVFAVVAIPDFRDNPPDPRLRALMEILDEVRPALDHYRNDHDGKYPGLDTLRVLEGSSPSDGSRPLVGYFDRIPDNPFTGGNHIGSTEEETGASDWVYDPDTGVFKANDSTDHWAW